mgnify:CR=1 FL=1
MTPLHRLSELAGILSEYHDIWGRQHATSDDTRRALLGAMGFDCGDAATIEAALRAWEKDEWRQRLPPVAVVTADTPARVTLRLPAAAARADGRWRLILESGEVVEGGFVPHDLEQLDSGRVAGKVWHARALDLPAISETGYHRLEVTLAGEDQAAGMPLIVAPERCYQPPAIRDEHRVWGLSTQLYGVRSGRNWGMGDFTDLRHLVEWAADAGAGLVGVNPLHALYPHNPRHASPYSPSSRRFLNTLYLDVEAVPEFAECEAARQRVAAPEFQARLRALRAEPLVDHAGVAAAKAAFEKAAAEHKTMAEQAAVAKTAADQAASDHKAAEARLADAKTLLEKTSADRNAAVQQIAAAKAATDKALAEQKDVEPQLTSARAAVDKGTSDVKAAEAKLAALKAAMDKVAKQGTVKK